MPFEGPPRLIGAAGAPGPWRGDGSEAQDGTVVVGAGCDASGPGPAQSVGGALLLRAPTRARTATPASSADLTSVRAETTDDGDGGRAAASVRPGPDEPAVTAGTAVGDHASAPPDVARPATDLPGRACSPRCVRRPLCEADADGAPLVAATEPEVRLTGRAMAGAGSTRVTSAATVARASIRERRDA